MQADCFLVHSTGLSERVTGCFAGNVLAPVPGSWIDISKIDRDLKTCTDRIKVMIEGLSA